MEECENLINSLSTVYITLDADVYLEETGKYIVYLFFFLLALN